VVRASFRAGDVLRAGNQAFRITKCLGLGAMGEAYEVEDQNLGVTRVVKLLRPELAMASGQFVDRFLREGRCLAKLRHPSVVSIVLADRLSDGTPFYVMEFVAGRAFGAFLAKHAPLDPRVALPILIQLASALEAVHAAGIIHRDVKPDNVLIWRENDGVRATLIDFGIMRLVADKVAEGFCGTPHFSAPEQIVNTSEPTVKIDIFALGILAFLMLARRHPYEGYTAAALRVGQPAPLLSDMPGAESIGSELTLLVAEMLSLDPTMRPTARQVSDRIVAIHEATVPLMTRKLADHEITNEELMSLSPLHVSPILPADLEAHTLPGGPSFEVLEAARRARYPTVRGQVPGLSDSVVLGLAAQAANDFDIEGNALDIAKRKLVIHQAEARSLEEAARLAAAEPLPDDPPRPRDSELLQGLALQWNEQQRQGSGSTNEPPKVLLAPPAAGPGGTLPMARSPLPGKGKTVPIAGRPSSKPTPSAADIAQAIREGNALNEANQRRAARVGYAKTFALALLAAGALLAVGLVVAVLVLKGGAR